MVVKRIYRSDICLQPTVCGSLDFGSRYTKDELTTWQLHPSLSASQRMSIFIRSLVWPWCSSNTWTASAACSAVSFCSSQYYSIHPSVVLVTTIVCIIILYALKFQLINCMENCLTGSRSITPDVLLKDINESSLGRKIYSGDEQFSICLEYSARSGVQCGTFSVF